MVLNAVYFSDIELYRSQQYSLFITCKAKVIIVIMLVKDLQMYFSNQISISYKCLTTNADKYIDNRHYTFITCNIFTIKDLKLDIFLISASPVIEIVQLNV